VLVRILSTPAQPSIPSLVELQLNETHVCAINLEASSGACHIALGCYALYPRTPRMPAKQIHAAERGRERTQCHLHISRRMAHHLLQARGSERTTELGAYNASSTPSPNAQPYTATNVGTARQSTEHTRPPAPHTKRFRISHHIPPPPTQKHTPPRKKQRKQKQKQAQRRTKNVLNNRRLVIIHIEVVGRGEDHQHGREARRLGLAVHAVAGGGSVS
jgi:hypothetical protein